MAAPDFINLYKGMIQNVIILKQEYSLADVRKDITGSIIDEDGVDGKTWRFLVKVIEIDTNKVVTIPYTDAVLGKEFERMTNAKKFIEGRNTLYLVNVTKPTPDLFGLKTPKFSQDKVDCIIFKNTMLSPDKLQPLMMERVRPLKNVGSSFNHVLVCQKNTAIVLYVMAKGHGAFGYSIVSDAGDRIVEGLLCYTKDSNREAACAIKRYQRADQAIVVDAIPTNIPSGEKFKRSRVTLTLWNVYSVTEMNGNKIDFRKPRGYSGGTLLYSEGIALPSDGIEGGQINPGGSTNVGFGEVRSIEEDRNDILGVIGLDLFVFKTFADAETIFEMNCVEIN